MMSQSDRLGAEVDLMVHVRGKRPHPVTIYVDMDGKLTIEAFKRNRRPRLTRRWIPRFTNGNALWSNADRQTLKLAMSLTSKAEAKVLRDVSFVRNQRAKDRNEGALYVQKNCAAKIQIFNRAFASDRWQFVGSGRTPYPASVRIILHEVAHAIHNYPARTLLCTYQKKALQLKRRIAAFNTNVKRTRKTRNRASRQRLQKEGQAIEAEKQMLTAAGERVEAMIQRGPVIEAYARVLGSKAAPTIYGRSSIRESFAESYSLFRADPAALKRLLPEVAAWFRSGGHMQSMSAQYPSSSIGIR